MQYERLVFTICIRQVGNWFDAEDLAQEVFVSAYTHLDRFDGQNMKAWLAKISVNKCRDFLKNAERRTSPSDPEEFARLVDPDAQPETVVIAADTDARVRALCARLREPYRGVSTAYFCDGVKLSELAAQTGTKQKTLEMTLYRAKKMLKELWEEGDT